MSVITWIQRRSRLSTLVDRPGGVSVGVALRRAVENLSALQSESDAIIATRIAELDALPAPANPGHEAVLLAQAYAAAAAVIDAASPFQRDDLCRAASGLCDLIDAGQTTGRFDWRIIPAHAQALRLLFKLPADAEAARTEVLDSLRLVLDHKLPPERI